MKEQRHSNDWRLVYVKAVYAYVSYWGKYSSRNKHAARKAAQFTAYTLSESEVHEWASAIRRGHAMGYKPFDGPHGSHYSFYIAA